MEILNYYTPSIEEFHVGFEYEYSHPSYNPKAVGNLDPVDITWYKEIFNPYKDKDLKRSEGVLDHNVKHKYVRVKYLDENDILSLGFIKEDSKNNNANFRIPDRGMLMYTYNDQKTIISMYKNLELVTVFDGVIKNKLELKKVLTQIGFYGT